MGVEHAVRRFGQTTFPYPGRISTSIDEHRLIIDAVLAGDPAEAERVASDHMQIARQLRLQMLIEGLYRPKVMAVASSPSDVSTSRLRAFPVSCWILCAVRAYA